MWIVILTLMVVHPNGFGGYVVSDQTKDVRYLANDRILESEADCLEFVALNWPAWRAQGVRFARCELSGGGV